MDREQATVAIRSGILRLNERQGTPNTDSSGYHETLTCFWIAIVAQFLRKPAAGLEELEPVNQLVEIYGERSGLWREYYSFDLVQSVESRRGWVEPDRKAITIG
jgi:hypothetical protein